MAQSAQQNRMEQLLSNIVELLRAQQEEIRIFKGRETIESNVHATINSLSGRLGSFAYDTSSGTTFAQWYQRHAITFNEAKAALSAEQQVELLLNALGEQEYRQLCGRVSPNKPTEMLFDSLVEHLRVLFLDTRTFFQRRYDTLTAKASNRNIDAVLDEVNLEGDLFEFENLNLVKFKLLLAAIRMSDPMYQPYRAIVLKDSDHCKFGEIREKCREYADRVINTNVGTFSANSLDINAVHHKTTVSQKQTGRTKQFKASSNKQCQGCGATSHQRSSCPFKSSKCNHCGITGQIAKVCRKKQSAINSIRINDVSVNNQGRKFVNVLVKNMAKQRWRRYW